MHAHALYSLRAISSRTRPMHALVPRSPPRATRSRTSQISLKSTAVPGRGGGNLKVSDFKYSRMAYWVTSREAPEVVWMEELKPSSDAVKAFFARDKGYATSDACYLDAGDSFDSFVNRWEMKTLTKEYDQVPLKVGDVGKVYPHFVELQDLLTLTKRRRVTCG